MPGNWGKSVLNLAKSMSDMEYYDAILRDVFDGFYPGYWKREDNVELFAKFLRYYTLYIKHYTIEELKSIEIVLLISHAKLEGTCINYFDSNYILMFLRAFPEINIFDLTRFPKDFWQDEMNIKYVIQHLIDIEYKLNKLQVCQRFTCEFLRGARLGALITLGYSTYDLLELTYPGVYSSDELAIGKSYQNIEVKLLNTSKKLLLVTLMLGVDLQTYSSSYLYLYFRELANDISSLGRSYNIQWNKIKEKAIELKESGKFTEEDLNLMSEEEKAEIKRKYAEYLKEKNN